MKILVLAVKELKTIFRETGGLFFMFLMPVALLVVFNLIFGGMNTTARNSPFRLPVVNQDEGGMGAQLVEQLKAIEWIRVEEKFTSDERPFTAKDVEEFVANGRRNQALIIPPDFSEKLQAGADVNMPFYLDPAVPIQYIGPVQGAIIGALYATVFGEKMATIVPNKIDEGIKAFEQQLGVTIPPAMREQFSGEALYKELSAEMGYSFSFDDDQLPAKLQHLQPASIEREKYPTMYQQNLSGYSVLTVFFIITAIGAGFFKEHEAGTFRRILAAPVRKSAFLIGQLLPYIIINMLQVSVLIALSVFFYGTDLGQHPLALLAIVICTSIAACGLGLLMVTLFRNRNKMESVSVVVVLISSALSGAFVPRFVMGDFVQKFSYVVPQSWAMEAFQDVLVRGRGLMDILPQCGAILLFALGFFAIALLRFRYE